MKQIETFPVTYCGDKASCIIERNNDTYYVSVKNEKAKDYDYIIRQRPFQSAREAYSYWVREGWVPGQILTSLARSKAAPAKPAAASPVKNPIQKKPVMARTSKPQASVRGKADNAAEFRSVLRKLGMLHDGGMETRAYR